MLFSAHKIEHYWFPNRAIFPQDCKVERPTLRMMEPHLRKLWGNRWRHRWKCAALCDVIGSRPSCGRVRFCFDRGWRYDSACKKKKAIRQFQTQLFLSHHFFSFLFFRQPFFRVMPEKVRFSVSPNRARQNSGWARFRALDCLFKGHRLEALLKVGISPLLS